MTLVQSILGIVLMALATIITMALIGTFSRRVLGMRIGTIRSIIAGLVGLGAGIGFAMPFANGQDQYTPALIPVQLGVILLSAVAFLVVAGGDPSRAQSVV